MVQHDYDPLTGAHRKDVLISPEDASRLGLSDGTSIVLKSSAGLFEGRCLIAPIAVGSVQAHWPEANVLLKRGVTDPECGIPDYNTVVDIVRLDERKA
jgi:anaerobic selenocysteine-containing dehydrogenase